LIGVCSPSPALPAGTGAPPPPPAADSADSADSAAASFDRRALSAAAFLASSAFARAAATDASTTFSVE